MKSYKLKINGQKYDAQILEFTGSSAKVSVNGTEFYIEIEEDALNQVPKLTQSEKASSLAPSLNVQVEQNSGLVRSPLPGVIVAIPVKEGDIVKKGQPILILEAMKMESEIASPANGKVLKIHKKEKSPVQEGDLLITLEIEVSKELPAKQVKASRRRESDLEPNAQTGKQVLAPLPGVVLDVKVHLHDLVSKDDVVIILEAMKMESEIHSQCAGKVMKINVSKGQTVQEGDVMLELEG